MFPYMCRNIGKTVALAISVNIGQVGMVDLKVDCIDFIEVEIAIALIICVSIGIQPSTSILQ